MKCIYCATDSKRREREDGQCPHCGAAFCFDPAGGDPFSDLGFKAMIDRVSADGTVRWGKEHLYYEACRALNRKRKARAIVWPVVGTFVGVPLGLGLSPLLFALVPLGFAATWWGRRAPCVAMPPEQFDRLWERWRQVHPGTRGLIERPPESASPRVSEADMEHYSFDRAVICDRARTVDLLLANNFHFENNCAVLGVNGYPKATFALVRKMLRRNPRLQVFVLHDATVEGCNLAHRLASDPAWFKGLGRVVDVGLRPGHAGPFRGAYHRQTNTKATGRGLLPGEGPWLESYMLELAAIRPEQVIKRLYRAISAAPAPAVGGSIHVHTSEHHDPAAVEHPAADQADWGADGGGDWAVDADSFGSDADASDGGADSFG